MLEGVPSKLQAVVRMRAAIAGVLSGSLAFVIWKNLGTVDFNQSRASQLAGLIFTSSVVAGFLATMLMPLGRLYKADVVSVTAGAGLRSGLIAALVSAAAITAASVAKTFDAPTRAADLNLRALVCHAAFVLFAALFSSVPAGVVGGVAGLLCRKPQMARRLAATVLAASFPVTNKQRPAAEGSIWFTRFVAIVSVLGMVSPLLLLFRDVRVDPPPVVVPRPPPPPPFRYIKPLSFDYVEPGQFVIAARKNIPAAATDRPMLFSSDSRLFAYCPANSGHATVAVLNLDSLEEVAAFVLPGIPNHLAWSPDFQRLFYVIQDNENRTGVLNLQTHSVIELPRPKNRDLPDGQPDWWLSNHVAFFPRDESALDLDLDGLLLGRLDESPAYKVAGDDKVKDMSVNSGFKMGYDLKQPAKTHVRDAPRLEFPKGKGWQMMIDGCVQGVQPSPRKEPSQAWNLHGFATLAFLRNEGKQSRQWMPQITFQQGAIVLPSPDGSKLVHLNGNLTEVIYFGTRERPPSVVTVKMPLELDKKKDDTELAMMLKEYRLCAFAYAPLTNPLTGKVIGPDREHLRAILRVIKWEGETADFWAAERFTDIRADDVVADLHTWEGGQIKLATSYADDKWWNQLTAPPANGSDAVPTLLRADDLDLGISTDVARMTYAFRFQNVTRSTRPESSRFRSEVSLPVEKPPVVEKSPPPVPEVPKPQIPQEDIERFITRHHEKASEPDIVGMMTDYNAFVDYLGKYQSRDDIQKGEFAYHRKWNHVTESLQGSVLISKTSSSYLVNYTIAFRTENTSENKWVSGENDLSLSLATTARGFEITKQTASIRNRKEGQLRAIPVVTTPPKKAGPPAVPITVAKPYWSTTLPNDQNPHIDMTDAINIQGNVFNPHRTFRLFNDYGQVLKSCRFQFRGRVTRQGNMLNLFMDELTWGKDSDREFGNMVQPGVDAADGSVLNFILDGENLVVPGYNKVLRPVR